MNPRGEKSPGLKILWLWTIGTAAILVTNVVRTRIRDLEQLNASEQQQQQQSQNSLSETVFLDDSQPETEKGSIHEVES